MLSHYLDLLRLSWKQILACAFGAGLLAYALSQFLLEANPIYDASVAITMQPSDEELLFNRTFMGVSQFNPATIIAQSHVERLLSRPVAERALDILLAEYGGAGMSQEPTAFAKLKAAFWRTWNTLNYGYHIPPTPRQQMINDIQESLDIEIVEGSYILNVTVSYDNPKIAAAVANVIAVAYADEARADFLREANEVVATIASQEEATKGLLAERRSERESMARLIGVNDVPTERTVALEARQTARDNLQEAEIDLSGQSAELGMLRSSVRGQTDPALVAEIQQSIVLGEASLERRSQTVVLRQNALAEIDASLNDLQLAEQQLAEIDLAVQEAELDLEELQRRRVALDLATKARLSQVRVINPAVEPVYPFFPKVLINTVVATIVGGALALAPVFAVDVLGNQVRTRYDLERIVGLRALPTISRLSLSRRASGRRVRRFAAVFGRRIATDGSGWPSDRLFVTGDLAEATIDKLRTFIAAVVDVAEPIPEAASPREVVALSPLARLDWSVTTGQVVVLGIPASQLERSEVEGILHQAQQKGARPYFVLVA
jgi:polysaccharide biosynthesis transport protein